MDNSPENSLTSVSIVSENETITHVYNEILECINESLKQVLIFKKSNYSDLFGQDSVR